ncbi:hypothetical protein EDC04DRAFT_2598917 [Pisolithus marmoratus]|nr:hypothetical protein EDC04DRAFT_2598917 [Pisolithus marmoratus]
MTDDEADTARAKMHSTVGQAIDIGKKHTPDPLLSKIADDAALILASYEPGEPIAALTFDHANGRIGDMQRMQAYIPPIKQSSTEMDDDDDATAQVAEVDII